MMHADARDAHAARASALANNTRAACTACDTRVRSRARLHRCILESWLTHCSTGCAQGAGYSTSKYEPGLHGAAAAAHDRKVEREQGGGQ
jgi:hypothetical protein